MPASKSPPPDENPQRDDPAESQRFIDMAREIGADESPEAMDRAFTRVVHAPEAAKTKAEKE